MKQLIISFPTPDRQLAGLICEFLQQALLPSGWRVELADQLSAGSQWTEELQRRIGSCDALVALLSKHSAEATWQRKELLTAQDRVRKIIPIRVDDVEIPIEFSDTQCPVILRGDDGFLRRVLAAVTSRLDAQHPAATDEDALWTASLECGAQVTTSSYHLRVDTAPRVHRISLKRSRVRRIALRSARRRARLLLESSTALRIAQAASE